MTTILARMKPLVEIRISPSMVGNTATRTYGESATKSCCCWSQAKKTLEEYQPEGAVAVAATGWFQAYVSPKLWVATTRGYQSSNCW